MIDGAQPLPWQLDPIQALRRFPIQRPVCLLHSGRMNLPWSRYSILASPTGAYRFCMRDDQRGESEWIGLPPGSTALPTWTGHPVKDLKATITNDKALYIGYLSYDVARFIEALPNAAKRDRHWPVVQFQRCPGWLIHDAKINRWFAGGCWPDASMPDLPALPPQSPAFQAQRPLSATSRKQHLANVSRAIQYIAAGDIFQVNLAQRFTAACQGHPRTLYPRLAAASPAWYGSHVELLPGRPDEPQRTILSISPELFLSLDHTGHVTTRPIKGTRPAHVDPQHLADSHKDAAELNMIIDLMRNDLGRVCRLGSVRVTQTRHIESHPTVHHGVATITGQLHHEHDLFDLLHAAMPGGSVTGAPKIRAMQIIDQLEPVRRGPYCGAIGFIHQGAACLNIAIRTLLAEVDQSGRGRVDFSVGGGIVADSDPAEEYQETLDKAAAMIRALAASS